MKKFFLLFLFLGISLTPLCASEEGIKDEKDFISEQKIKKEELGEKEYYQKALELKLISPGYKLPEKLTCKKIISDHNDYKKTQNYETLWQNARYGNQQALGILDQKLRKKMNRRNDSYVLKQRFKEFGNLIQFLAEKGGEKAQQLLIQSYSDFSCKYYGLPKLTVTEIFEKALFFANMENCLGTKLYLAEAIVDDILPCLSNKKNQKKALDQLLIWADDNQIIQNMVVNLYNIGGLGIKINNRSVQKFALEKLSMFADSGNPYCQILLVQAYKEHWYGLGRETGYYTYKRKKTGRKVRIYVQKPAELTDQEINEIGLLYAHRYADQGNRDVLEFLIEAYRFGWFGINPKSKKSRETLLELNEMLN
jgi:hypothetical protein